MDNFATEYKSKIIRSFLCLLMALCMMLPIASCANAEDINDENPTESADTVITEQEGTTFDDGLEELDFGGQTVTIISRYLENWTSGEISVEKLNSEIVNDAVFNRELNVEDRLNIKIESTLINTASMEEVINIVAKENKSGSCTYNICAAPCFTVLTSSLKGNYRNLKKAEYLDLTRDWWSHGYSEVVEYDGAQYAALGSMLLSQYRFAFVTVFNKDVFDRKNTAYLYDYVNNNEWTLDKQCELAVQLANISDDGNTAFDKNDNFYGLISNSYIGTDPYWSSCEIDILKKNTDGKYEYVFDVGKLEAVCTKLMELFYSSGATYNFVHLGNDDEQKQIRKAFADGRGAMATLRLLELEDSEVRNMKEAYGVAPMPKYDENQKEYHTLLHDQFTVVCVPSAASDDQLNLAGAVLEAMSIDSYHNLTPAYYETALKCKYMNDQESWKMLDIISKNIYIDAGIIYTSSLGNFHSHFRDIMGSKKNTVSSKYASLSKSMTKKLGTLERSLDKIKDK